MKKETPIVSYNILEERLNKSREKKSKITKLNVEIDEVMDNAKKHFEEIFNRI